MKLVEFNPFRPTRWEHQRTGHHLIWFAQTADLLTGDKSVYVRGSRGSGKTTLLKSICWDDLLRNPSLQLQRKLEDFNYIGVYVQFPDHISSSLSHPAWEKVYPDSPDPQLEMHKFFSLAVELVCLDRCLTACHEMRVARAINLSPTDEQRIVQETIDEFPKLGFMGDRPQSFHALARTFRSIVREMNQACGRGTINTMNEYLPPREPGELLKFVTTRLSDVLSFCRHSEFSRLGFKFCLDDCEVLSGYQQRSLNTLVRGSKHPVSWIVSSVGSFFDTYDTFIDQQPLTDHDRKIVTLDGRGREEFRSLCQAVLSLRLYFAVSETVRKSYHGKIGEFFSLDNRLGRRDVNEVFGDIISKSTAPYAILLNSAAHHLRTELKKANKKFRAKYPPGSTQLPYYETYIALLWDGGESFKTEFSEPDLERLPFLAKQFSSPSFEAWLRRKQTAALLHFAAKLGVRRLPLGGVSMISALADGSVRDFLEIVGEIFDSASSIGGNVDTREKALSRFASSRSHIAWDDQTRGIMSASASYLSGISTRSELDSSIVTRFIDGLGHYTATLQSNPDDPSVLGRAERGIFTVRLLSQTDLLTNDVARSNEELIWKVVRQAELAGYIRTLAIKFGAGATKGVEDAETRVISFRLHHRFAPHFRFSYRGAYETVALSMDDLVALLDRSNQTDSESWAKRMGGKVVKKDDPDQLQLPFDGNNDDD